MIHWSELRGGQMRALGPSVLRKALSAAERRRLERLRLPKRRGDWVLGRFAAKCLIQAWLEQRTGARPALSSFTIGSEPSGAPQVTFHDEPYPLGRGLCLSISHSRDTALCALSARPGLCLGADLEWVEPRPPTFVNDYFTDPERDQVEASPASQRDSLVTVIWSAKEAVLKALGLGLTVDTRRLCCRVQPEEGGGWSSFRTELDAELATRAGATISGWWSYQAGFVRTIAAGQNNSLTH